MSSQAIERGREEGGELVAYRADGNAAQIGLVGVSNGGDSERSKANRLGEPSKVILGGNRALVPEHADETPLQ